MSPQSSIRIIGGKWRSRKVHFIGKENLRPTPDRVRETLFNWLTPYIVGSECLDLYAGSGVLGFECLSRGAKSVVALEYDRECCEQIEKNKHLLQADDLQILHKNTMEWLQKPRFAADIVFVDPPYKQGVLAKNLQILEQNNWVHVGSLIYFEQDKPLDMAELPENWALWRDSKAGKVYYFLAIKER